MTSPNLRRVPEHSSSEAETDDDLDIDWAKIRTMPMREKVEEISNHALDVFQQVGAIHSMFAQVKAWASQMQTEVVTIRENTAAARDSAARCETIVLAVYPNAAPKGHAATPPVPPQRERLPSLFDVDPNDITAIKEFKKQSRAVLSTVSKLERERDDRIAVEATHTRWLKTVSVVVGILVGLSILGAGACGAATYLSRASHAGVPAPVVEDPRP